MQTIGNRKVEKDRKLGKRVGLKQKSNLYVDPAGVTYAYTHIK